MSKAEMLQQSAHARNTTRVEALAHQVQAVRQARLQSAEDLAAVVEPLTQALSMLSDETRSTLDEIDHRSRELGERFQAQLDAACQGMQNALQQTLSQATRHGTEPARPAGRWLGRWHIGWAVATAVASGTLAAVLVSAFWLWISPPSIQNLLDPKAMALWLKPAVIEALKPSKGR
jgi:uncharacterized protein YukE